jgi:hypothetical protein
MGTVSAKGGFLAVQGGFFTSEKIPVRLGGFLHKIFSPLCGDKEETQVPSKWIT